MHEKIRDIQNTIWKIYKNLCRDYDMNACNRDLQELNKRYQHDELNAFCENTIITWIPVFQRIKENSEC